VGVVLVACLLLLPPQVAVLAGVTAGAAAGARALLGRRASRARRSATARHVLEACEQVAAELAAGQPPAAALSRAARDWPGLAPVADAQAIGADVPAALRAAAREPGAEDLRVVAAAWHVAHRSGRGLADAVDRVVGRIRSQRQTRRVVESELASARATARLVAGLPVLALAMGSGAGGNPWLFLVQTPVGVACLVSGLALGLAGLWWIESIADGVERP
jgi:tight adherence protein B